MLLGGDDNLVANNSHSKHYSRDKRLGWNKAGFSPHFTFCLEKTSAMCLFNREKKGRKKENREREREREKWPAYLLAESKPM